MITYLFWTSESAFLAINILIHLRVLLVPEDTYQILLVWWSYIIKYACYPFITPRLYVTTFYCVIFIINTQPRISP